jgi:hypothetical protein
LWGLLVGGKRMNGGDEGDRIRLMDFTYIYEIE